jgi:transcriptional antiterminator RfaH
MSLVTRNDSLRWYAIHSHRKQESRTESNLKVLHIETFLPKILDTLFNEFTGKPTSIIKPLFPGYLFARFVANDKLHKVRYTRGVHNVICVGHIPAAIDDKVIEIIAAQVDEDGFVKLGGELRPGAKVLIQTGPFRGLTGIFERETKDTDRIKILLDCARYQVHVEVEKSVVKSLSTSHLD